MTPDLLDRTRALAKQALARCATMPNGAEAGIVKRQLIRAVTSVGAAYRAARRSH